MSLLSPSHVLICRINASLFTVIVQCSQLSHIHGLLFCTIHQQLQFQVGQPASQFCHNAQDANLEDRTLLAPLGCEQVPKCEVPGGPEEAAQAGSARHADFAARQRTLRRLPCARCGLYGPREPDPDAHRRAHCEEGAIPQGRAAVPNRRSEIFWSKLAGPSFCAD